jgi:hypothetical protein
MTLGWTRRSLPDASTLTRRAYFALDAKDFPFPHPLCPDKGPVPAGSLSRVLPSPLLHFLGALAARGCHSEPAGELAETLGTRTTARVTEMVRFARHDTVSVSLR